MLIHSARVFVAVGWALCLVLVLSAYGVAYFSPSEFVGSAHKTVLLSLSTILGLIAPHLTLVINFYLGTARRGGKMDKTAAWFLLGMCSLYWLLLVVLIWTGVVFRRLAPYGTNIDAATSIVVGIAGLLSFLAIRPTVKLFVEQPAKR